MENGINIYLESRGVREPHWHPNAVGELNSVSTGRARTTIFILGIKMDRFEVDFNEIVFIPSRYFHCTKNIDSNEIMQFAIFFNEKGQKILAFQVPLVLFKQGFGIDYWTRI